MSDLPFGTFVLVGAAGVGGAFVLTRLMHVWLLLVNKCTSESRANLASLLGALPILYVFVSWAAFTQGIVTYHIQQQLNLDPAFIPLDHVPGLVLLSVPILAYGGMLTLFHDEEDHHVLHMQHAFLNIFMLLPICLISYALFCFFPSLPRAVAGWVYNLSPLPMPTIRSATEVAKCSGLFYKAETWWLLVCLMAYLLGFGSVIMRRASGSAAQFGLRIPAGGAMVLTVHGVVLVSIVYLVATFGWLAAAVAAVAGWLFSRVFVLMRSLLYFYLE